MKDVLQPFEKKVESLRSAHFVDTYEFVTGALISDLLQKDHFVALNCDFDMCVRLLAQLNAAEQVDVLAIDVLTEIMNQKFSQEEIDTILRNFRIKNLSERDLEYKKRITLSLPDNEISEEEIDLKIKAIKEKIKQLKNAELKSYPNIEKVWDALCAEIPELKKVSIEVLPEDVNPLETSRYVRDMQNPKILLPFNWRLNVQLIRNIYPFKVDRIAELLGIHTEEVTDEMILLQQFVHEVGHAVFQLLKPTEASHAALERLRVEPTDFNYKDLKKLTNKEAIEFANRHQQEDYGRLTDERVAEEFATQYFQDHTKELM